MRGKALTIIFLITAVIGSFSQHGSRLDELLATSDVMRAENASLTLQNFLKDLHIQKSKLKSDQAFLRFAFRESHKKYLKNYKAYSQFPEIFLNGNYDCLTATSFLSLWLDEFKYSYELIETNYHIFIIVQVGTKRILIEPTDSAFGFIANDNSIGKQLKAYKDFNKKNDEGAALTYYHHGLDIFQTVDKEKLTGLLYLNQAIESYNKRDYIICAQKLKLANMFYNNPRVKKLAVLLVTEVAEINMDSDIKKSLIMPFASVIKEYSNSMASR
jgi:hypothetical protein